MNLRVFIESDLNSLKRLVDHTIDISYKDYYPQNAIKFLKQYHEKSHIKKDSLTGFIVVLEKKGQIIGTGTLKRGEILRVFISPRYQGSGFGKIIMRALEDKALENNINKIKLDVSLPSIEFYEKLGYEINEETSFDVGEGETLQYYKASKLLKGYNSQRLR